MKDVEISTVLFRDLSSIIEHGKEQIAFQLNSTHTLVFWQVGDRVNNFILNNRRAEYGKQIIKTVAKELVLKHGKSFEIKNLHRMMQFAKIYPSFSNIVPLARQLSWSHFLLLFPLKSEEARNYYSLKSMEGTWGKRELKRQIERKSFERTEIAQINNNELLNSEVINNSIFKDPYILDFLELSNSYLEKDLESAIMREIESFILELGVGFTFVERQKRMIIDGKDFNLDLLFYHRKLKRLIAIELKLTEFKPSHKGQMELYLKWLNRYEKQEGENMPIGLILCAEASKEQIELLEMHKDGILVSEYWSELPPKAKLEKKLHNLLLEAKERITTLKLKGDD